MAEEIIIGKLVVDNSELNAAQVESKKRIVELTNAQKTLKKETNNLADANEEQLKLFIEQEGELKALRTEYNANQKSILALTKAQTGLDVALAAEVRTQNDAIANTKDLIAARRQLDTTTEEGAKAIAEINAKIDANNKLNNASNSLLEQQKANIGDYGNAFKEASANLNPLNGGLEGFVSRSKEAGGAGNLVKSSLGGMATGFVGVAKAGLAFIATPIGAVVLALVVVFTAIKNAMNRSEEATAKVTKIFAVLSGAVNALMKLIVPLGEYFINEYVKVLEQAAEMMDNLFESISRGLKFLGLDSASGALDGFTNSVKESIKVSLQLADAELALEKSQRKARLTQLQYQKEAEQFRQIRDDETKSITERIAANDALGQVLKNQLKDELLIAETALKVANLRIEAEGQTSAALDAQADALTEIADIQERITSQESEQLTNRVSLQKEAAAKAKEIRDKAEADSIKNAENEIEILKLKAAASDLTTEQLIANAQEVYDRETELLKRTAEGTDLTKGALEAKQTLSSALLAITTKQIEDEAEAQKAATEAQKATTAELYNSQKQSAEDLATAQIKLLDKELLSERDYADGVIAITKAKNETLSGIQANFDEAEKVRRETAAANQKALDDVAFEIRLQDIQDRDATEQEIKAALEQANYDRELEALNNSLANKEISEEVYLGKKALAEKKFNAASLANEKTLADQKKAVTVGLINGGIAALESLFGESKSLSIASALMNTYEGITAALKAPTIVQRVAGVAFAATTGFAAVKNILSTSKDSTGGSTSTAASVSTSGTGSFTNSESSETIARVSERPTEQNTVMSPPVLVLETLAEVQDNVAIKVASS